MKSLPKLYKYHVVNLREVNRALDSVAASLRKAIAQNNLRDTSSFMRLYALLIGVWAECRLKKLVYEPYGFTDDDRNKIEVEKTQLDQWIKAVELSFRKQYKVPKAKLTPTSLKHSSHSRYKTLLEMLNDDLSSIIELRNKLAHGQWIYPLNSSGDDVSEKHMKALNKENLMSLQFKKNLLETLAGIIHDLLVSKPTFERDFDKRYGVILETRQNLQNRDYQKYAQQLQEKHERGKVKRAQNFSGSLNKSS